MKNIDAATEKLVSLENEFKATARSLAPRYPFLSLSGHTESLLTRLNADDIGASRLFLQLGSEDDARKALKSVKDSFTVYAQRQHQKAQKRIIGRKSCQARAERAEAHSRRVAEVAQSIGMAV